MRGAGNDENVFLRGPGLVEQLEAVGVGAEGSNKGQRPVEKQMTCCGAIDRSIVRINLILMTCGLLY
jgi:hypothetical protein